MPEQMSDDAVKSFITLCLYFFQGNEGKISQYSNKDFSSEPELGKCVEAISKYRNVVSAYNLNKDNPDTALEKKNEHLKVLYEATGKRIKDKRFWKESEYPRGLINKLTNDRGMPILYIEAIMLYLLRGYCTFILGSQGKLEIKETWVKHSLNDFLQSYYLARSFLILPNVRESLYRYSACSEEDLLNYCDDKKLGYLLSWIFIFIDIFKGNVFYKVFDYKGAFENYCGAITKYKKIRASFKLEPFSSSDHRYIYSKTIVKVYNEKAKCYFEQGQFMEALKWLLKALSDLLLLSFNYDEHQERKADYERLFNDLQVAISFFDFEKDQPTFSKEVFKKFFSNEESGAIRPNRFEYLISVEYQQIASDVFVRISFLLYTLRLHSKNDSKLNDSHSYILDFVEPVWPQHRTAYGTYLHLFFRDNYQDFILNDLGEFRNIPGRIFACLFLKQLREIESSPYSELGIASMRNIDNIVTMPEMLFSYLMRPGYKERAGEFHQEKSTADYHRPLNKFVVLRRWQSFNPKIPRPRYKQVPGGGYFLMWQGKGVIIDPGYNFIQNFYEEGFSIDDIDAIAITHSHPDHDDDLSTILTLLYERNDYYEKNSSQRDKKYIDLFLNEGSYRKYSSWLYAPNSLIKNIYLLQNTFWDRTEKEPKPITTNYCMNLDLRERYSFELEIVPSWHDEIIAKYSSVGLKFKLFKDKSSAAIIGITGDTFAYSSIESFYEDCDIMVAHLGDIKIREIISETGMNFKLPLELENICSDLKEFKRLIACLDLGDISGNNIRELILETNKKMEEGYEYKNHLGLRGLIRLHRRMCIYGCAQDKKRIFVIGEFPEELGSYKQMVAQVLNRKSTSYGCCPALIPCLTGDIGLHIGIGVNENPISIRCNQCNQNNELVHEKTHYHPADKIQETIVKRENNGMVYLCKHHAMLPDEEPKSFLSFFIRS